MASPAPTTEQQQIIAAAKTGGSLVIEAGAGTGKTATLKMIAEAMPGNKLLYLAYNKRIQVEAASKFPQNVECRTAHSLAYFRFGRPNTRRLNGRKLSMKQYAAHLGVQPFRHEISGEPAVIDPRQLAVIVKEAVGRFCNSADREVNRYHIPYQGGAVDQDALVAHLLPYLQAAWRDITNPNGALNFTHDCYLKMWSLSNPTLHYDTILFDEAQDANPAIAAVVQAQSAQQIMVGDRAQAIYGWRGAVDAMQNFKADHHLYLSQSFRFGQAVADEANRWLAFTGTSLRLKGYEPIQSTVETLENPNCVLCRTNAGVIQSAMHYQEQGYKVAITGGTKEIEMFCKGSDELMDQGYTSHPDLAIYRSWSEVEAAIEKGEAKDIAMMSRLVKNYGTPAIRNVCRNSSKPEEADIEISTAHKAKGIEWDRVQIHSDFQPPKDDSKKLSVSEAMLIYVAITRARQTLDNDNLAWLADLEAEISGIDNDDAEA